MLLDVSSSQWVLGRGLSSETKEQLSPLTSLVSLSETESKSEISTLIPGWHPQSLSTNSEKLG